jgi:hypothetical protein
MTAAPTTTAIAVSSMGRKRTAPASMTARQRHAFRIRSSMKSTRMMLFRTTMPPPAMKPIMLVAEKKASIAVRRQNADERERNGDHDDGGRQEAAEPADHEHVNQDEHAPKAAPRSRKTSMVMCHSPSHFIAGSASLKGMEALRILQLRAAAAELAGVELLERLVHLEDGIHGAFDDAGDIADDVGHGHEVLVIEALLDGDVLDLHQLTQRHERRSRWHRVRAARWHRRNARGAREAPRAWFWRLRGSSRRMLTSSFSSG